MVSAHQDFNVRNSLQILVFFQVNSHKQFCKFIELLLYRTSFPLSSCIREAANKKAFFLVDSPNKFLAPPPLGLMVKRTVTNLRQKTFKVFFFHSGQPLAPFLPLSGLSTKKEHFFCGFLNVKNIMGNICFPLLCCRIH